MIGCFATAEGGTAEQYRPRWWRRGGSPAPRSGVNGWGIDPWAMVLAADGGSDGELYLVSWEQTAVQRVPLSSLDGSRGSARLSFDGASAEPVGRAGGACHGCRVFGSAAVVLLALSRSAVPTVHADGECMLQRYVLGRMRSAGFQAIKNIGADM